MNPVVMTLYSFYIGVSVSAWNKCYDLMDTKDKLLYSNIRYSVENYWGGKV